MPGSIAYKGSIGTAQPSLFPTRRLGFAFGVLQSQWAASESARHQRPRSLARLTCPAGEFNSQSALQVRIADVRERTGAAFYLPQAVPEGRGDKLHGLARRSDSDGTAYDMNGETDVPELTPVEKK